MNAEAIRTLIDTPDLLTTEQLAEAKTLLSELADDERAIDDRIAVRRLHEAGVATTGAPIERARDLAPEAALLVSGVPLRESETVEFDDLPMLEKLAVISGVGDERAAALSESSKVPFRGGDTFLRNEVDLRATFGEAQEDVSADELLRRGGLPMREVDRPAHQTAHLLDKLLPGDHKDRDVLSPIVKAGAAVDGDQRTQLAALAVKHKGLLEGNAPDLDDLEDAQDGEDVTDAAGAPLGEAEGRALLLAGGIPMRHGSS